MGIQYRDRMSEKFGVFRGCAGKEMLGFHTTCAYIRTHIESPVNHRRRGRQWQMKLTVSLCWGTNKSNT
jgi:hypothetical protein